MPEIIMSAIHKIIQYTDKYQKAYCDLYIATWKEPPYLEFFTSEEIIKHLGSNKDFLYLLIEEATDKAIGFVGGRPIAHKCDFFINDSVKPIDISKGFYIAELVVEETHKKHGWGYMLMQFLICNAREKGFNQFVLRTHSNHSNPAIGLYYKSGMKPQKMATGEVHGVDTEQRRITGKVEKDFRIYFYKTYQINEHT